MRVLSRTSLGGVIEQLFTLDEIPGVLWTPEEARGTRPLILMGHGGGQHKKAPGILARARRFAAEGGFAVAAIDVPYHGERPTDEEFDRLATEYRARAAAGEDTAELDTALYRLVVGQTVADWQAVLTAVQRLDHVGAGPVGYWGVSLGCALGMPFIAAEPRVRAAVLGLQGSPVLAGTAAQVTVPVQFLVQWDDELMPREQSLALFDALGSAEKTLHANPGKHGDLPQFEWDDSLRFFARHLG
ncbi:MULTISPECIES: alpha/beta hydrolase [unclassified Streptomyces]|uniref:dienelactone hydrolase family protein n=1 Tax=unclassified Streptomyces TaxID=2593676 RepID=UPI00247362B9|nr:MULTISPECIES: alpha/beta hydrolase [unclassified Streptomyces]MDH6455353.1 dienelactone hydrolase [Streptomyces sp. SAI-119]MDH6494094.1 dienelactone hydrolase [Streptomyces sp. SAI-149]